jgi:hypothetical protein
VWKNVEFVSAKQAMLDLPGSFMATGMYVLAANTISFTLDCYLLCHHPIHTGVAIHSNQLSSHCVVFLP